MSGTKPPVVSLIDLRHPINECPATAVQKGWYCKDGRAIGLTLQFPDGFLANLTYEEIRELREVDLTPE